MGYSPTPERLFPGEASAIDASLPWGFMTDEHKQLCLSRPHECADCGMSDLPWQPGWRLCTYCAELRGLRRAG